ncbi:MAG TPA: hypothetical protein PKY77_25820 [Phycisphaerae bacterium]|nr:hypothetical protein [Phycisphaerae bacterium]HRY68625.1 hypothetical protein [Phycisphaerae bacterium]HSA25674.1 hypothetical protein [Phycisphaerae bacterium]
MKSVPRLVDAGCMSESATLLDAPKPEATSAEAGGTTIQAAEGTGMAAIEAPDQTIDALLDEVSMVAEAVEASADAGEANATETRTAPDGDANPPAGTAAAPGPSADAPADAAGAEPAAEASELSTQPPTVAGRTSTGSVESPPGPDPAEQPDAGPAPRHAGENPAANPWADEVAQLEDQWAHSSEEATKETAIPSDEPLATSAETPSSGTPAPAAEGERTARGTVSSPSQGTGRFRALASVARTALAGPVLVLVVLDKPFAKLSPGLKNLIGCMAIATTMVASASAIPQLTLSCTRNPSS